MKIPCVTRQNSSNILHNSVHFFTNDSVIENSKCVVYTGKLANTLTYTHMIYEHIYIYYICACVAVLTRFSKYKHFKFAITESMKKC